MPNLYSRFQTTSRAFIELSYFTAAQAANPERRFIKLVQVNTYAVVCVCVFAYSLIWMASVLPGAWQSSVCIPIYGRLKMRIHCSAAE